jgi:hypothetical protein
VAALVFAGEHPAVVKLDTIQQERLACLTPVRMTMAGASG